MTIPSDLPEGEPATASVPVSSSGPVADRVTHHTILDEEAGQRLDHWLLRHCKGVPKSHLYRVIRGGEVRVNRKRVGPEHRLAPGDALRIPPIRVAERAADVEAAPGSEFPILLEDDDVLAIDKPAGVAVHGGSGVSYGVIEQLRAARPRAKFLELVHRLDRETSGVLLLAKRRSALVALHAQLQAGTTDKRYAALVRGRMVDGRRHLKQALLKTVGANGERHVRVVDARTEGAQLAHTTIDVRERFAPRGPLVDGATLVDAQLRTGRTHQIRVHLAHLEHPILGDERYGDFALNKAMRALRLKRMFLHAHTFAFEHPRTGAATRIEAPLPPECIHVLEILRAGPRS